MTRTYGRVAAIFVCTFVLWCSAAAMLALAAVASTPDSDTGRRSSTTTVAWLILGAVALVLASGPLASALARQRRLLALPLVGAAIGVVTIGAARLLG